MCIYWGLILICTPAQRQYNIIQATRLIYTAKKFVAVVSIEVFLGEAYQLSKNETL